MALRRTGRMPVPRIHACVNCSKTPYARPPPRGPPCRATGKISLAPHGPVRAAWACASPTVEPGNRDRMHARLYSLRARGSCLVRKEEQGGQDGSRWSDYHAARGWDALAGGIGANGIAVGCTAGGGGPCPSGDHAWAPASPRANDVLRVERAGRRPSPRRRLFAPAWFARNPAAGKMPLLVGPCRRKAWKTRNGPATRRQA